MARSFLENLCGSVGTFSIPWRGVGKTACGKCPSRIERSIGGLPMVLTLGIHEVPVRDFTYCFVETRGGEVKEGRIR